MGRSCRVCKVTKPENDFSIYKSGHYSGRRGLCKKCEYLVYKQKIAMSPRGRAYAKAYYRGKWTRYQRSSWFGLSQEQFDSLVSEQGGVCKICGRKNYRNGKEVDLAVDHDHETMEIRGLLCNGCNACLRRFSMSHKLFDSAQLYMRTSRTGLLAKRNRRIPAEPGKEMV